MYIHRTEMTAGMTVNRVSPLSQYKIKSYIVTRLDLSIEGRQTNKTNKQGYVLVGYTLEDPLPIEIKAIDVSWKSHLTCAL